MQLVYDREPPLPLLERAANFDFNSSVSVRPVAPLVPPDEAPPVPLGGDSPDSETRESLFDPGFKF